MISLITSSNVHNLTSSVVPSLGLGINLKIRKRAALMVVKKDRFLGFEELKITRTRSGLLCKGSLESEAELVLEGEILEFMKNSRNPDDFPTKKELLDAGRIDLVNAVVKRGGWLSLGWDDSDDEHEFDDIRDSQTRLGRCQLSDDEHDPSFSSCTSSHQSASPSANLLKTRRTCYIT